MSAFLLTVAAAATLSASDDVDLADALFAAVPGDVVELGPGTFEVPLDLGIDLTITGAGPGVTVIEPTDGDQVVRTSADVLLADLTVDGAGDRTGVRVLTGTTTLRNVEVAWGSSLTGGGGAHVEGELICEGCTFHDNHGEVGGGGIRVASGRLQATDSRFQENHSNGGGALWVDVGAEATVASSVFCGNHTHAGTYMGGAIRASGALVVERSVFAENVAATNGGALHVDGTASAVVRNNTFYANDSLDAAALHHEGGPLLWVNNLVSAHPQGTAVLHVAGAIDAASGHQLYWGNTADTAILLGGDLVADPRLDPGTLDCYASVDATGLFRPLDGSAMVATGDGAAGLSDDIGHLSLDGPPSDFDADGFDVLVDCDDGDPAVSPVAEEVCNGVDDDCDGIVNEEEAVDARWWQPDQDLDGFGSADLGSSQLVCQTADRLCYLATEAGAPSVDPDLPAFPYLFFEDGLDCNDNDPSTNPSAPERCDDIDHNCNGDPYDAISESIRQYPDADGDGFGDGTQPVYECVLLEGHSEQIDCDDTDPAVSPNATEAPCDGTDNDCDPLTPDDDGTCPEATASESATDAAPAGCGCRCDSAGRTTPTLGLLTRRRAR